MKLCQNMSEEENAILIQLARRHTMAEARRASDLEENRRKTSRAKSLEGFDNENLETDLDDRSLEKTHFSGAPTVIITESELASSRLYNDRKAKINSDDEGNDKPDSPSDDPVNSQPRRVYDPNIRPVPVPMKPRREKFSSCCCYFLVILLISISSLGVMAAIGGVIYMELFAVYKETLDIPVTAIPISSDMMHLDLKENFSRTADENVILIEKEIHNQEHLLVNRIQNSKNYSPDLVLPLKEKKILHGIPAVTERSVVNNEGDDGSEKLFNNIEINKEMNANLDPQPEDMDKSLPPNSLNEFARNIHSQDKNQEEFVSDNLTKFYNISRISQQLNTGEISQETKIFETEKISANRDVAGGSNKKINENNTIRDQLREIKLPKSNTDVLSAILKNLVDSNKEIISEDFKLKIDPFNTSQTFFEKKPTSADSTLLNKHLAGNNSVDIIKTNITEQGTSNSFEQQIASNMKNEPFSNVSFNASHKETPVKNTTHLEQLNPSEILKKNHSEINIQKEHSVNQDFKTADQDKQAKNISQIEDQNNSNNSDSSKLMLIHPVVESRAVPVPVEFLRRLGFDIKGTNNHQPLTAKDMEIKFSLAEALKYLRSLDSENKLPTSRQKTNIRNIIKQNTNKNPEPIQNVERKEYLKNLRIKLFEEKQV